MESDAGENVFIAEPDQRLLHLHFVFSFVPDLSGLSLLFASFFRRRISIAFPGHGQTPFSWTAMFTGTLGV